MSSRVFFHIGLHKTATGWFQNQLFPSLNGLELLRSRDFAEILPRVRDRGSQTIVVSNEDLGGTIRPHKALGEGEARLKESLRVIATEAPSAAIIVGFREHSAWLKSAYAQRAKKESMEPDRFLQIFSIAELNWCHLLGLIEGSCGAVFPFLYEEIEHDPWTLVADLCNFLGVEPAPNLDALLARRVNPSPRSSQGQFASRIVYRLARSPRLRRLKIVDPDRVAGKLRVFGFRFGAWLDHLFHDARSPQFSPDIAEQLRQDWSNLLCLVGQKRGRDFSALDRGRSSITDKQVMPDLT